MNVLRFLTRGEQRLSWLPEESASPTSRYVHRESAMGSSPVAQKTIFEYSSSAIRFRLENLTKKLTAARAKVTHDNCGEPNTRFKNFFTQHIEPLFNVMVELDQQAEQAFQAHRNISIPALIQVSKRGILPVRTLKASPVEAIILLEAHIADKLTAFQEETEETVLAATADKLLAVTEPYRNKHARNRSPAEKAFIDALLKITNKDPSRTHNLKTIYALTQRFVNDKKKYLIDNVSNELEITVAQIFHPYEFENYEPGTSPLEGHEVFTKLRNEVATNKNEAQSYLEQLRESQSKVLGDKILYTLTALGITLQANKKIVRNIDKGNDTFIIPVIYQDHTYDLVVTCELAKKTDPDTAKVLLVDIIAGNSSRKINATVRKLLAPHVNLDLGANGDNLKELLRNINNTAETEKSLQMLQRRGFKPSIASVLMVGSLALAGIGLSIHQLAKKLTSNSPAVAQTTPPRRTLPPPVTLSHTRSTRTTPVTHPVASPTPNPTPNIRTPAIIATPPEPQIVELASVTITNVGHANAEWALAQTLRIAQNSDNTDIATAVEPLLAANSIARTAHLLANKGESLVTASRRVQHRLLVAQRNNGQTDTRISTWSGRGGFHTSRGDTFKLVQQITGNGANRVTELRFVHIANDVPLYTVSLSSSTAAVSDAATTTDVTRLQTSSPSVLASVIPHPNMATCDDKDIDPLADLAAIDSKCRPTNTHFSTATNLPTPQSLGIKSNDVTTALMDIANRNSNDNYYWDPDGKQYQSFMQPTVETKYIDQDSWRHKVYLSSAKANIWMRSTYNTLKGTFNQVKSWFS